MNEVINPMVLFSQPTEIVQMCMCIHVEFVTPLLCYNNVQSSGKSVEMCDLCLLSDKSIGEVKY